MKRKLFIGLGTLAFSAGILFWLLWANVAFRVAYVSPSPKQFPTSMPYIDIILNHPLQDRDVSSSISVSEGVKKSVQLQDPKTIRVNLQNIGTDKSYTLLIQNLRDTGNKVINKTIIIHSKYVPFDKLTKSQQAAVSKNQDADQAASDPVLSKLPHSSLNYTLTAGYQTTNGQQKLTIKAQILLTASDVRSNEQAAIDQYKQDALGYLKSVGIDTTKYDIQYDIVEPSIF